MSYHCLLVYIFSDEKSAVNLIENSLYMKIASLMLLSRFSFEFILLGVH